MDGNEIKENKELYRETLNVNNIQISVLSNDNVNDFISLTELSRYKK